MAPKLHSFVGGSSLEDWLEGTPTSAKSPWVWESLPKVFCSVLISQARGEWKEQDSPDKHLYCTLFLDISWENLVKISIISVEVIRGCRLSSLVWQRGWALIVKCSCLDGFLIRAWEKWQRTLPLEHSVIFFCSGSFLYFCSLMLHQWARMACPAYPWRPQQRATSSLTGLNNLFSFSLLGLSVFLSLLLPFISHSLCCFMHVVWKECIPTTRALLAGCCLQFLVLYLPLPGNPLTE